MASLCFAVAALMASVAVARAAREDPTKYSSNMNTLQQKKKIAEEGCRHVPQHTMCRMSCVYKSIGVLNRNGRYNEKYAADVMAIFGDNNKINPESMKAAARACNSVNNIAVKGCGRAIEVTTCLQREYSRVQGPKELLQVVTLPH